MYSDGSSRLVASILREIYSASCLIKISPAVMLRRTILHKVLHSDKSPMCKEHNVLIYANFCALILYRVCCSRNSLICNMRYCIFWCWIRIWYFLKREADLLSKFPLIINQEESRNNRAKKKLRAFTSN